MIMVPVLCAILGDVAIPLELLHRFHQRTNLKRTRKERADTGDVYDFGPRRDKTVTTKRPSLRTSCFERGIFG